MSNNDTPRRVRVRSSHRSGAAEGGDSLQTKRRWLRPWPQLALLIPLYAAAASVWFFVMNEGAGRDPAAAVELVQQRRAPFQVFDLRNATVPRERIQSGGPPVDGIPAISEPQFVAAAGARFLDPRDRVIGVAMGGESRAYPLKILNYHEAVNDQIGDVPFAVTYCPLCDSAAVFDRRIDDQTVEFGISGLLLNSNVLLYDRQAKSLWPQVQAQSIAGPKVGESLRALPVELTTWADWSSRYPETQVLSTNTGHRRDYSGSPYSGYFNSPELMFPVEPLDRRLPDKTPVLGIWGPKSQRAYPIQSFAEQNETFELEQELDGLDFTLVYEPAARSLRISQSDDGLQWLYSFWFAWAAFRPETEVFSTESSR